MAKGKTVPAAIEEWPAWVSQMSLSATAELEQQVERLRSEGVELLSLGLGEPDFGPSPLIRQAAVDAVLSGFDGYTASGGTAALKDAVRARMQEVSGVAYERSEVMASIGGKHVLFNTMLALLRAGDEAIIPMPYWVSFPEQVKFAGGVPVCVPTRAETGYKLTPEELEARLTAKTRLIILNSPGNPSGAVYTPEELEALARLCRQHNLWAVSDEVYAEFNYRPEGHSSIAALPGMRERTVIVQSLSKGYGMPGWRLGFAAAPAELIARMTMLQSHTTSNPPNLVQQAAIAALTGPQDGVAAMRERYRNRRRIALEGAAAIPGFHCLEPEGAFYLWADIRHWIGRRAAGRVIADAGDLSALLLELRRVVVMPGTAFGSPHHLRISFAADEITLRRGLAAIRDVLTQASPAG
ncbi:pyridoxal phosphate-dependent aminotransferase [Paenibacillus sp. S150]|uniref:pyridoxal phosphate-dependent aminotransferase n=1 Tax=Paenibacillus sp. S150 TaxID=2749826 RepID=UPI001C56D3BA|nr:pyridoxal phosphate-dependent aminotransferase [Paenibacillus sp. S150]MBW4081997.1 pyridoxal phosphate-dependent aminotransferase [Paenibacillus sp. S150]